MPCSRCASSERRTAMQQPPRNQPTSINTASLMCSCRSVYSCSQATCRLQTASHNTILGALPCMTGQNQPCGQLMDSSMDMLKMY